MTKSQATEQEKDVQSQKPVSPHLAWETPKHSPNETDKQKGQLGQNVRQREQAERKGR